MSKILSVILGVLFIGTLVVTLNTSAVAFSGHGSGYVYRGSGDEGGHGYRGFGDGGFGYGGYGRNSGVIVGNPSRVPEDTNREHYVRCPRGPLRGFLR